MLPETDGNFRYKRPRLPWSCPETLCAISSLQKAIQARRALRDGISKHLPVRLRSVEFRTTRTLNAREGLTIVVAWPKGYVAEPDAGTKFTYFVVDNRGVLIGSFGLIVIFLYYLAVWVRSGRDPAPGVIVTRYTPPDTMSPAVMRYIAKMGYDDRTFAAAVINMAVKGFLKIVEEYGEYTLQKKDGGNKPPAPEEERIMKKLLGASGEITLETANHLKIKSAIDALRNYLDLTYEKIYFITNKRYFIIGLALTVVLLFLSGLWDAIDKGRLPFFLFICLWLSIWSVGVIALLSQVVNRWKNAFRNRHGKIVNAGGAVFLTLFAIPFVAGQFAGMAILGYSTSVLMIFFLLLASFINYLFYHLLKAPTRAGRNILDAIEGFKVFLSATEKERLNMLNPPQRTPELFEKYLPYALALDIEQQWAEQFADILSGAAEGGAKAAYAPVWYSGAALSAMTYGDFALPWEVLFQARYRHPLLPRGRVRAAAAAAHQVVAVVAAVAAAGRVPPCFVYLLLKMNGVSRSYSLSSAAELNRIFTITVFPAIL